MTAHLLEHCAGLVLFEIDRGFAAALREIFADEKRVELVEGDVLQEWPAVCRRDGVPERVIGNLPYNVGSRIIASLIEEGCIPERMVVTVQREVGQRMMARPGTPQWSSFSVLCQFAFTVQDGGDLQAGSFYPPPKVTSKIVVLTAHRRYPPELAPRVSAAARELFSARRKTIRNALKGGALERRYGREQVYRVLGRLGIDPGRRGETLATETVVELVLSLEQGGSGSH
jgi:16S rRNA (adenine1518-N6/adenine1519-N6)-dimethyltransferase